MPRRYKLGPEGEMRRTWGGKLPEEFGQRDMLAFMVDTDLRLSGKVSKETTSTAHFPSSSPLSTAVPTLPAAIM